MDPPRIARVHGLAIAIRNDDRGGKLVQNVEMHSLERTDNLEAGDEVAEIKKKPTISLQLPEGHGTLPIGSLHAPQWLVSLGDRFYLEGDYKKALEAVNNHRNKPRGKSPSPPRGGGEFLRGRGGPPRGRGWPPRGRGGPPRERGGLY